jgi:hypothetical protein
MLGNVPAAMRRASLCCPFRAIKSKIPLIDYPFLKFPIIFFLIITASDQRFVWDESVPSFSGGNGAFSGGNAAFPPENAPFPPRIWHFYLGISKNSFLITD